MITLTNKLIIVEAERQFEIEKKDVLNAPKYSKKYKEGIVEGLRLGKVIFKELLETK